jgi:hypothetical protein
VTFGNRRLGCLWQWDPRFVTNQGAETVCNYLPGSCMGSRCVISQVCNLHPGPCRGSAFSDGPCAGDSAGPKWRMSWSFQNPVHMSSWPFSEPIGCIPQHECPCGCIHRSRNPTCVLVRNTLPGLVTHLEPLPRPGVLVTHRFRPLVSYTPGAPTRTGGIVTHRFRPLVSYTPA